MTTATVPSLLPTEKAPPRKGIDGKKMLLYGPPKVGKSTFAAQLTEAPLFLATDPGQDALEVFRVPITSWADFLAVGKELKDRRPDIGFDLIVVDTIDTLARLCRDHVMQGLVEAAGMRKDRFVHPSDFEYGKGWDAVAEEFRLRIAGLCALGVGVLFISHVKQSVQKTRTGVEIDVVAPDVGQKGMRQWLLGFVDFVLFAHVIATKDGDEHVLQLKPTQQAEAGGRIPEEHRAGLPERISLNAVELRETLEKAFA